MRILECKIKNFKAIGANEIAFNFSENIVTLVGANNCGKSSILEALDYFFSGAKTIPISLFHKEKIDEDNAIVITVTFSNLTEEDKGHAAIHPYISSAGSANETWVLKKKYFHADGKGKAVYCAIVDGVERENPAGLTQNSDDLFTEEKMQKIYVPAVKDVTEVIDPKKKSPLVQVFQLLLSSELQGTQQHADLLEALKQYSKLFTGGTKHKKIEEIEKSISEKLKRIISVNGLIDVEVIGAEKLLPTPILKIDDTVNMVTAPELQGHGVQRALIFALLEMLAESVSLPTKTLGVTNLILIEEPEIFMHPQMEHRIADVLYALADSGVVQVICTTHSPNFVRMFEKQKSLIRVVREGGKCTLYQAKDELFDPTTEDRERLRATMNFDASSRECFFSEKVVLMEGDTEYIAIPRAAELLNAFDESENQRNKREVSLINCKSRDSIPAFQRVLNYFHINYMVVHDLEGEMNNYGANLKILELLDNDESKRKTCPQKFEDVIGLTGGKWFGAYKRMQELHDVGTLQAIMGPYVAFVYGI